MIRRSRRVGALVAAAEQGSLTFTGTLQAALILGALDVTAAAVGVFHQGIHTLTGTILEPGGTNTLALDTLFGKVQAGNVTGSAVVVMLRQIDARIAAERCISGTDTGPRRAEVARFTDRTATPAILRIRLQLRTFAAAIDGRFVTDARRSRAALPRLASRITSAAMGVVAR